MRAFAPRTTLLSPSGEFIRALPAALASSMVQAGVAEVAGLNGKIRSIRLLTTAATHACMIGPPEGTCRGVRFAYREMLEASGARVWVHHRRAVDYE